MTGSYDWIEYLADYRRYDPIIFNYLTIATRLYTDLSIGPDETEFQKYIARPDFVRGYDRNSTFYLSCPVIGANPSNCSAVQLLGSRVAVANVELRFPLVRRVELGFLPVELPPLDGLFFYDGGLAWSQRTVGLPVAAGRLRCLQAALSAAQLRLRPSAEPVQLRDRPLGLRRAGGPGRPQGASGRGRCGRASDDARSIVASSIRERSADYLIPCARSSRLRSCSPLVPGAIAPVAPATRTASTRPAARGPDALVLRVPRNGGVARVSAYPNIDSRRLDRHRHRAARSSACSGSMPTPASIAAVDAREHPLWLDLRVGTVNVGEQEAGGAISCRSTARTSTALDPTARWRDSLRRAIGSDKLPRPARAVFPQIVGTLVVLGGRGADARLWRLHPPDDRDHRLRGRARARRAATGAPLGDRALYDLGQATPCSA